MTSLPTHDNASLIAWLRSHHLGTGCGPGAALGAFRADLTALLTQAAAGRREYAANAPYDARRVLDAEAATLDAVAVLVGGDMGPMRSWLPSWRWGDAAATDQPETTTGDRPQGGFAVEVEVSGYGNHYVWNADRTALVEKVGEIDGSQPFFVVPEEAELCTQLPAMTEFEWPPGWTQIGATVEDPA